MDLIVNTDEKPVDAVEQMLDVGWEICRIGSWRLLLLLVLLLLAGGG